MLPNVTFFLSGAPIVGREPKALQFFSAITNFYNQKKEKGEIESIETFVFDDFCAETGVISIIRGDPEKLEKLIASEEGVSFGHQAELLFKNFRMVRGFAGPNMQWRIANFAKQIADLSK